MDENATQVLVVGSGPVGLMMANLLVDQGIRCRIVTEEAALRPVSESRAEGVHGRSMELFRRLGFLTEALQQGRPAHGFSLHSNGRRVARVNLDEPASEYPGALILEQGKVERLLAGRLERRDARLERGWKLTGLVEQDGAVWSDLRGPDGCVQQVRSDYVVGCDGAHSATRRSLGVQFEGEPHPGQYALADVEVEWLAQPLDDDLHVFMSPLLILGRLADGSWKIAALAPAGVSDQADASKVLSVLQERADEHGLHLRLGKARWTSMFRISNRQVAKMKVGRVFLAGDAAHIHSPMGGQGMNEGMQDALNLAWKLGWVLNGRAEESILETYHAEREPLIAQVLQDTAQMTSAIEAKPEWVARFRDATLRVLAGWEAAQPLFREKFSGSQRRVGRSILVREDRMNLPEHLRTHLKGHFHPNPLDEIDLDRGPASGQRVCNPDGLIGKDGEEQRLSEARDYSRFSLFVFAGTHADATRIAELNAVVHSWNTRWFHLLSAQLILRSASDRSSEGALIDSRGETHRAFGARDECCYLVRPDDVIGFRCQPVNESALIRYLEPFAKKPSAKTAERFE